ncbi:MAG: hypothetical protein ACFFB2_16545, partial [Promethearchaeota archaeon]
MDTEKVLLERARDEEKDYNWIEAANKYQLAVNYFLDRKLEEKAAEALKKQAYVYSQAAITTNTTKDYLRFNKSAIRIYKKAAKLFNKNNNEPEGLECKAEALFVSGFIENSVTGVIEAFNKSYTLFIKSKDQYLKKNDQESVARTFIRASIASFFLVFSSSEKEVIEEFCQKGREMAEKAWEISRKIGDHQLISESLFAEAELAIFEAYINPIKRSKEWEDYIKKLLLKADESLKILVECTDSKILGIAQFAAGFGYNLIGHQFIEDEKGQNEYAVKGIKLLENSLQNARKSRDNFQIIITLVYLNWWNLFWGRFKDLQTRIFDNINELVEYGKKYSGFCMYYSFYANFLPSFIYANFAQRSFFTTKQRIMFAENSIHSSKECLKAYSSTAASAGAYQMLTWSYSQLTTLTTIKDKQEEYAQEMLRYARSAEKIAEKYEGGWTRASGYSSLYRAFKTLADITQNKEKKIKMLTSAAAAADQYVDHAVESRTGVIGAQIRAGLLYEELGI